MPSTPFSEEIDPLTIDETSPLPALPPTQPKPVEEEANALLDVMAAPVRGLEGAVRSVYNLADFVTGDSLPNWDKNFTGTSKTTAGSIVENTSEFLAGFIPVFGWLGKAGKAAGLAGKAFSFAHGAAAGAIADFSVFDGQQERLSNLIQSVPALANPVSEYLARDPNEGQLEGRFKNTLEGLGLGALTDGLMAGLKGISKARGLKAAGASAEEVNKAMVEGFGDSKQLEMSLDSNHANTQLPATKSKESIKSVARASYENGQIDVTKYVDSSEDLHALLKERQAYIVETHGTRPVEPIEQTFSRVGTVLSGFTGKSEDSILSSLRAKATNLEESTSFGLAAVDLMKATAGEAQKYAKLVASGEASNENMLKSLAAQERLAELISISSGFGTLQGRALNARKYIKGAEIQSKEIAKQLVEQFGGTGALSKNLEKIAAAASPEGVSKLVSGQLTIGGRLLRAHNEYWINAILSGPKTSVVNALGNTFTTLYLPLEGAVGAVFRGDTNAASAFLKQYVYIAESVQESTKFAFQALKSGDGILDAANKTIDTQFGGKKLDAGYITNNPELASKGLVQEGKDALTSLNSTSLYHLFNFTGEVARLPQRFLAGTDEFFKQLNYRSAAKTKLYFEGRVKGLDGEALAASVTDGIESIVTKSGEVYSEAGVYRQAIKEAESQGLEGSGKQSFIESFVKENWDPTKSALAQYGDAAGFAKGVAQEATFTRELGDVGKKLQALTTNHPLLQIVMPFVRTPTNMLKFVGQRTFAFSKIGDDIQLPVLSWLHKRSLQEMSSPDRLVRSQAMGRAVMGQAMFTSAAMLALNGKITGKGPSDENERKLLTQTGWQPYSVVLTGDDGKKSYVSFQRLDPLSTFFSLIADWSEVAARQDAHHAEPLQAVMNSALTSLAANVTNKSYLSGISQVLDALSQPDRFAPRYAKKQLGSYIPNIVAQIRGDLDGDNALKEVRTYHDAIFSRLPGLQGQLEPKRNLMGQSVDSALATTPLSAVNPFTVSPEKDDKVFAELAKLKHGFQAPSPAYGGVLNLLDFKSEKGQSAYDRWLELHGEVKVGGKTLHQSLEKLVSSSFYNKLADQTTAGEFRSPRVAEVERIVGLYRRASFAQTEKEYPELKQALGAYRKDQLSLRRGQQAQQLAALVQK